MNNKGVNPNVFCLTSVIVGMIVTDELSYVELNALGNWLVLLGDYLLTYAASEYANLQNNINTNNNNELDYLYNAIKKMEQEIENIKKETN